MKRMFNKSISISFITILFIIIISSLSSCFAATTTVGELWDKCAISGTNYDVYCTQPTTQFIENSSYNVGDKYEVVGNIVKKNGTVVAPGTDEYKYALKMAYILATPDTALSKSSIDNKINSWKSSLTSEQRRSIYNGIYDLTSIRQTAIWLNFSGTTKWNSSGTVLKYNWYLGAPGESYGDNHFTIVKNADGTYSFSDYDGGYVHGTYENIGDMKFLNGSGNSQGYYAAAVELKNNANSYTGVSSEIENKTSGVLNPDYSNASYIQIGPIKLEHNSALTLSTPVEVYDEAGNRINGATMVKSSRSYGSEIYIRINKSGSLPLNISKVRIEYRVPNSANSTWYKLYKTSSQNLVAGKGSFSSSTGEYEIDLDIDLVPPIQIKLEKVDTKGNKVSGPKFKVEYSNGLSSETKTVTGGQITFTKRTPANLDAFTATITETDAGSGYKLLSAPIVLQFTYDSGKWNVSKKSGPEENVTVTTNIASGVSEVTTKVENKSLIEKITILKTNSQSTATKIAGAKFKVTLTNIESIGYYSSGSKSGKIILSNVTTNSSGNIVLEDLVIDDIDKNITIEIEETESPSGYKKIDGIITVELKRSGDSYTVHTASKDSTVLDSEFMAGNVKVTSHQITLNIKNIPIMNIGGVVWEDGQIGAKEIQGPNGKFDVENEKGMPGITVKLYNNEGQVTTDIYGNKLMTSTAPEGGYTVQYKNLDGETTETITLAQGEYIFPNIEGREDYYVVFEYNGIKYQTVELSNNLYGTTSPKESKAEETGRTEFNNRFKVINNSTDLSNNTITAKTKNYLKDSTHVGDTWTTDGKINKGSYALDVNCGLAERYFDLAVGMDVDTAKLTINGKETTYNYNQILNGDLEDIQFEGISNDGTTYGLELYASDYNYRIDDYSAIKITDSGITEGGDSSAIKANETDKNKELRAFVTYKVIIKNQSAVEGAKVNRLAYYYDTNYEFVSVADGVHFEGNGQRQINGTTKNYAELDLSGIAQNLGADNYRQEIYITFEVKKQDTDGDGEVDSLPKNIECANIVEILEYQTDNGLVDDDSQPGNCETQYNQDDTDEARGINIKVTDNQRKISGTVFEDENKDSLNNDSKPVNDVIVQLIEIKKISGQYYEYIWQETRSGSNTVKKLSEDGTGVQKYSYDDSITIGNGEYLFTDFIPGNYIIRYIYGDGTSEYVKTYNGQDYQSTKDPNYKASWYNTAGYVEGQSVARDNEARRLEVMAYSTIVDNTKGQEIQNKTEDMLGATWMAAETSRIYVPVDCEEEDKDQIEATTVSFEHINDTLEFKYMNFGLALRPQTKLTLEKHITSLKIAPTGVGSAPVVDAKVKDIKDDVLNGELDASKVDGVKDGLAVMESNRDNRNFWKVETDVEELAQGAQLEVVYTYVIKNESEKDYLSEELVNEYKADVEGYSEYLNNLIPSLKAIMKSGQYAYSNNNAIGGYLGNFYYTGDNVVGDELIPAQAYTIKEALNEQFGAQTSVGDYFTIRPATDDDLKTYIHVDKNGNVVEAQKDSLEVIESNIKTQFLTRRTTDDADYTEDNADWTKTAKLTTVLSSASNGTVGGNYPSYIAEITKYSNAAGRVSESTIPGNLAYIHSEDNEMTMANSNEEDEFWGETIIISKPTGEDKLTGVQIATITTISVAILGVGIVLIKKLVLKK